MIIFYCAIIIAFTFVICYVTANKQSNSILKSALNPFYFVLLLNIFFILDFYYLLIYQDVSLFEYQFVVSPVDIENALVKYAVFLTVICIVIVAFQLKTVPRKVDDLVTLNSKTTVILFKGTVLFVVLMLIPKAGLFYQMVAGDISRQVLFSSNQILHIAFSLIIPSFALFAAYNWQYKKKLLLALTITLFFTFVTGSRGNLLLIAIIFAVLYIRTVKIVPAYFLFLAIPFVAILLLSTRYFFRESFRYESIFDFIDDKGGVGEVFFNTAEISMAEVLVTVDIFKSDLERYPFESFIGGLMFPIPRAIAEFKPLGSGGVLTEYLSPMRWELTRSEVVTTGFGDLLMQFGFIGAVAALLLMTFFWVKAVVKIVRMGTGNLVIFLPFLMWWAYMFLRADIFNAFSSIWSFCIVLLGAKILMKKGLK